MSCGRSITRIFVVAMHASEFTCNRLVVASEGYCETGQLSRARRDILAYSCSEEVRKACGPDACPTIEAIFDRVLASTDALGIVPIENSSGGTVYDSVDLLIRHAGRVFIREELAMDVRIALLGRPGKVISTVYSHFVQIKHHADWLKARHPRARVRAVANAALAARKASASKTAAALASPGAADVYGLEVLEVPSMGRSPNVTHFLPSEGNRPRLTMRDKERPSSQRFRMSAAVSIVFWVHSRGRKLIFPALYRVQFPAIRRPIYFSGD